MTLNELSLSIWESLGASSSFDSSVLSRVLDGKRLFTTPQLTAFCRVLRLPDEEKQELTEALLVDKVDRIGLNVEFLSYNRKIILENIFDDLQKIRMARKSGNPKTANFWADNTASEINQQLNTLGPSKELLRFKALVLVEKLWILADTSKNPDLTKGTSSIAKEIFSIAKETKDTGLETRAKVMLANMHYLNKNYQGAIIPKNLDWNFDNSSFYKPLALRNTAISHAMLKRSSEFDSIRNNILQFVPQAPINIGCMFFEGLARASAYLDRQAESYKHFHQAVKIHKKIEKENGDYSKLRKIQIIRTELELALRLGVKNKYYLIERGKEGIIMSQDRGYNRHAASIQSLLSKMN